MQIEKLVLQTKSLNAQYEFYINRLGFTCIERSEAYFSCEAGHTILSFIQDDHTRTSPYHFAFNIPSAQLTAALAFLLERKIPVLENGEGYVYTFEDWNAQAVYFMDAENNILECIARANLVHLSGKDVFSAKSIDGISEIGIVTDDMNSCLKSIRQNAGYPIWRETGDNFKALGDENGLFILVSEGRNWYPTSTPASPVNTTIFSRDLICSFDYACYHFVKPS